MTQTEKFDIWALIELFGHSRMAGRVQERTIGSAAFLQVDVPETKKHPAFSRLLNPSAIYAINPLDEETARHYAETINSAPIKSWDISEFMEKAKQAKVIGAGSPEMEDKHEPNEDYD